MSEHTFHYWLIGRPETEADAAYDAGLTDGVWIFKGGMMFVEFKREAETMEIAAAKAAEELRFHKVPFDERTLNLRDPTDFLSEHPGYYDDDELKEIVDELAAEIAEGTCSDADVRLHGILAANLASGNGAVAA